MFNTISDNDIAREWQGQVDREIAESIRITRILAAQPKIKLPDGEPLPETKRVLELRVYGLLQLFQDMVQDLRQIPGEYESTEFVIVDDLIPQVIPQDVRLSLHQDMVNIVRGGK